MDGVRILSPKTVALMMENHLDVPYKPGIGFGLGGQVVTDVGKAARLGSEGAFSWSGAANTYFFIDPEEELIAFAWTQLMPYGRYELHDSFRIAVYQAIAKRGELMLPGYRSMNVAADLYEVYGGEFDWFHEMRGVFAFDAEIEVDGVAVAPGDRVLLSESATVQARGETLVVFMDL